MANTFKAFTAAHDKFFKNLYQNPVLAVDIFRIIFPPEVFALYDWANLRLEKDSFVDGLRADLIFSVPILGFPDTKALVFIVLEHKGFADSKVFWQIYMYQHNLIKECYLKYGYVPKAIPVVCYHGKRPWTQPLDFQKALEEDFFRKNPSLAPTGGLGSLPQTRCVKF